MYYAEVNWLNEYNEDIVTHMFVMADSYEEAMVYIGQSFDDIYSIKIEEFYSEECHIVYIPKEVVEQVKHENI